LIEISSHILLTSIIVDDGLFLIESSRVTGLTAVHNVAGSAVISTVLAFPRDWIVDVCMMSFGAITHTKGKLTGVLGRTGICVVRQQIQPILAYRARGWRCRVRLKALGTTQDGPSAFYK
jgi:hypothetical protein